MARLMAGLFCALGRNGTASLVSLQAALGLPLFHFLSGLGALGFVCWRSKRKAASGRRSACCGIEPTRVLAKLPIDLSDPARSRGQPASGRVALRRGVYS